MTGVVRAALRLCVRVAGRRTLDRLTNLPLALRYMRVRVGLRRARRRGFLTRITLVTVAMG